MGRHDWEKWQIVNQNLSLSVHNSSYNTYQQVVDKKRLLANRNYIPAAKMAAADHSAFNSPREN
jgi:hypothetical protein